MPAELDTSKPHKVTGPVGWVTHYLGQVEFRMAPKQSKGRETPETTNKEK